MNGDRLKQAREFLGLNQTELANRVGVSQSTIAYIESGRLPPSEPLVTAIASETGFPVSFFHQGSSLNFALGSLLYRSRTSQATAIDKTKAYRFAELAHEFSQRLMAQVKPLPVRVPQVVEETPAEAAKITRGALGVSPDKPIGNLVNTLERAGVLVAMLPFPYQGIDAFSVWAGPNGDTPVIMLSPGMPPDRQRLTVAHELGHLVIHRTVRTDLKQLEREAHAFAGELLFPDEAFRHQVILPITLTSLAVLKPRWGMSIQALIMRAFDLEVISLRQKTYLFQQVSARKWNKAEPGSELLPMERPRGVRQLAEMKYGNSLNYWRISTDLHLPIALVEGILESCAPSSAASGERIAERPTNTGKVVSLRPSSHHQQ